MASMNSQADARAEGVSAGTRGALPEGVTRRRAARVNKRKQKTGLAISDGLPGWPKLEGLKPVLAFLCVPAVLVLGITLSGGGWPKLVLYPIALAMGLYIAASAFRGVELVLACMLIYLPFSKEIVVPIAPGVNGTNMLVLLGLFAALLRLGSTGQKLANWPPGTTWVFCFAVLSSLSAFTITLIPGGRVFLVYQELLSYKAWLDQFIFYFIALMCIRDIETAKRCVVYVMLGSMLVVLYAVPEMLEKMGRSTIDKSRIGGPHLQSNNFGGFVAYTVLPLIAVFVVYIKDIRVWLLTPYFLLTAKVLITTFSRGAYLAMLVGGLLAGWYKGKGFLMMWVSLLLCVVLAFPSLIPDSIVARMQTLTAEDAGSAPTEEKLDKSSSTRLVLWGAAWEMIKEDPVWGKGFKGFQLLKADYTETDVSESDPHSMYLYIAAQMGIPSLVLFIVILGYSFFLGRTLSRCEDDPFIRAIGIGGAASTACFAVVCIFGSRAVSLNFTAYFWTLLVVMQVIRQEQNRLLAIASKKPRRSTSLVVQTAGAVSRTGANDAAATAGHGSDVQYHGALDDESLGGDSAERRGSRSQTRSQARKQRRPARGAAAYQALQAARQLDTQKAASEASKPARRNRTGGRGSGKVQKRVRNLPRPAQD